MILSVIDDLMMNSLVSFRDEESLLLVFSFELTLGMIYFQVERRLASEV